METVFNVFLYITGPHELIREYGMVVHSFGGTDAQKTRQLQLHVADDFKAAKRFPMPDWCLTVDAIGQKVHRCLTWDGLRQFAAMGRSMELFEDGFAALGAAASPLIVVTPIVDGEPRIDAVTGLDMVPAS